MLVRLSWSGYEVVIFPFLFLCNKNDQLDFKYDYSEKVLLLGLFTVCILY